MKSKALPLWARLACTALAALAFLLVYERLVYGVPFGQIYLPARSAVLPPGGLRCFTCMPSRG